MNEHKLTDTFVIRRDAFARPGVERYQLVEGNGNVRMVTSAGTIADVAALGRALVAFAGGLTVGAALALPQVQDGTHAIEAIIGLIPEQWACRPDENGDAIVMARMWRPPARRWRPWSMMSPDGRQFLHTCRLVPIAEADADPATRGGL